MYFQKLLSVFQPCVVLELEKEVKTGNTLVSPGSFAAILTALGITGALKETCRNTT